MRRDIFPWSHFSEAIEILLLPYIDKEVDVVCACPASSLVQTWRRRSRPHSCNVDAGHYCSYACLYATTGTVLGRDSAVNCGGSAVGAHRLAWLFRAVYTGTRPGLTPAIRAGKGWRGRRELAPRCSATQLVARRHDPGQTRRVLNDSYHTHHTGPL